MRLGPLRLNRHRAARALAGFVAAFLLTGNVLAAAGLCVVRAPAESHASSVLPGADASAADVDCAEHGSGHPTPASNAHHCPTEDPSAQSRTVDVPAAQLMAAAVAGLLYGSDPLLRPEPLVILIHPAAPQPLYARLQRLRL